MDFLGELESKIIPADGAMGTALVQAGVPKDCCFEELCLSQPDVVRDIHEQYIAAGARMISTNTFGANGVRLASHGFVNRVNEINWSAAQLAKQCARGKNVFVAGCVGPLGITAEQAKERGIERKKVFAEQVGALLDGGVNLVLFATFTDLEELALALYVKQSLHHCPAVCSMACSDDGRLASGETLADAFGKLRALDAEVVGINCVSGEAMLNLMESAGSAGLLAAFPNAGMPRNVDGRLVYDTSPQSFAETGRLLAEKSVRLIGGCCGTGPRHIAALAETLNGMASVAVK